MRESPKSGRGRSRPAFTLRVYGHLSPDEIETGPQTRMDRPDRAIGAPRFELAPRESAGVRPGPPEPTLTAWLCRSSGSARAGSAAGRRFVADHPRTTRGQENPVDDDTRTSSSTPTPAVATSSPQAQAADAARPVAGTAASHAEELAILGRLLPASRWPAEAGRAVIPKPCPRPGGMSIRWWSSSRREGGRCYGMARCYGRPEVPTARP